MRARPHSRPLGPSRRQQRRARRAKSLGTLHIGVLAESELAGLRRAEQRASALRVSPGHDNLHPPESIERESVSLAQRLAPQHARYARRLQEGLHLLRLDLAIRDKHAARLLVHEPPSPRISRPGRPVTGELLPRLRLNASTRSGPSDPRMHLIVEPK